MRVEQVEINTDPDAATRRSNFRRSTMVHKRTDSLLTWHDLGFEVTVQEREGFLRYKKSQKRILEGLNGYVRSGECLAIIGGSGAGKSSMMNLLCDRVKMDSGSRMQGKVLINGQPMSYDKFKHVIGFVMQADIFLEHLTVGEYFKFAVDLKAPGLTAEEKKERLTNAVQIMKLEKAKDNFVGGIYRKGISGGEKKRLNIGFELLGDPSLLFLDEPTSGLDSYTSFIIMTVLRQIAIDNNIIVVYTIHQPSIETFNLFDNLLILDRGKNIYFGKASEAITYYAKMDYPVPANTNPANHFISLALRSPEKNELFYQSFNSTILPQIESDVQRFQVSTPFEAVSSRVGFFEQYRILLVRAFKNFSRNPMATLIRMVQICFLIIIFNMLYFRMSEDFSQNINVINREGAFFLLSINLFISYFQNYLLVCELTSPRGARVLLQGVQLRPLRRPPLPLLQTHHRTPLHLPLRRLLRRRHLLYRRLQPRRRPLLRRQ